MTKDMVNNPPHYQTEKGIEAINVIEAFGLCYKTGNAIKYILRAGRKGKEVEDYRKAIWYLERKIKEIEGEHV